MACHWRCLCKWVRKPWLLWWNYFPDDRLRCLIGLKYKLATKFHLCICQPIKNNAWDKFWDLFIDSSIIKALRSLSQLVSSQLIKEEADSNSGQFMLHVLKKEGLMIHCSQPRSKLSESTLWFCQRVRSCEHICGRQLWHLTSWKIDFGKVWILYIFVVTPLQQIPKIFDILYGEKWQKLVLMNTFWV